MAGIRKDGGNVAKRDGIAQNTPLRTVLHVQCIVGFGMTICEDGNHCRARSPGYYFAASQREMSKPFLHQVMIITRPSIASLDIYMPYF